MVYLTAISLQFVSLLFILRRVEKGLDRFICAREVACDVFINFRPRHLVCVACLGKQIGVRRNAWSAIWRSLWLSLTYRPLWMDRRMTNLTGADVRMEDPFRRRNVTFTLAYSWCWLCYVCLDFLGLWLYLFSCGYNIISYTWLLCVLL